SPKTRRLPRTPPERHTQHLIISQSNIVLNGLLIALVIIVFGLIIDTHRKFETGKRLYDELVKLKDEQIEIKDEQMKIMSRYIETMHDIVSANFESASEFQEQHEDTESREV
ncbi:MAG: hypothetical protein O3A46_14595, partial [Candidatus Poribacteria bacterium]|nr:hypothetical protein [Candidatus Poribacteria bacterium]